MGTHAWQSPSGMPWIAEAACDQGGCDHQDQRFGLHDLKCKGITDTPGTRADKQQASGHRSESMMDVYDMSVAIADPSAV
jgi:hypothetical protein